MKDIIIVGASGFGRELAEVIEEINRREPTWRILGFLDDNPNALEGANCPYKLLGSIEQWRPRQEERYAMAIAAPVIKEEIVSKLKDRGAQFATIIHPSAGVSSNSRIGEGAVLFGQCGVSVNVEIGEFAFLNALVGVGHDAVIGPYSMIGPKCCISGHTTLGRGVTMGALASTYPGVSVGDYATIGMNSTAIRRVKPHTTVVGVPGKVL